MKLYLGMVKNRPTLTNNYVKLRYMLETSKILNTSNTAFFLSPPPPSPPGGFGGGGWMMRENAGGVKLPRRNHLWPGPTGIFTVTKLRIFQWVISRKPKEKSPPSQPPPPQPPIMKWLGVVVNSVGGPGGR